jgi:pimeloyl-ACP methyl ester carboxylesterase
MAGLTAGNLRSITVAGIELELNEQGSGPPLLFLHPGFPLGRFDPAEPVLALLAKHFRVLAPTHPGFGRTPAPDWMTGVDDLSYLYLDMLDALDLNGVVLAGASFGGWIAAEMAVKSTARLSKLVLANPVGVKFGDRETRDFVDVYSIFDKEIAELAYADASVGITDNAQLSDDVLYHMARSREATSRYAWQPYLHNPKLKHRLHRIDVPTLLLWGEADRITRAGYGKLYADLIPGAVFQPLKNVGHYPHKENPAAFADAIAAFAAGKTREVA